MRRRTAFAAASIALLGLGTSSASGLVPSAAPASQRVATAPAPAAQSCFQGGSGPGFIKVCVSKRGNIVSLESPSGAEHIDVGFLYDGYVLCKSIFTSVAYDTAFVQSGFLAPTVSQPGGPNTLPLTITRKTADGDFRLSQTFGFAPSRREFQVTMKLTNLSTSTQSNVGLGRVVDVDADGDPPDDVWDESADGIWGRDTHAVGLFAGSIGVQHGVLAEDFSSFASGIGSGDCNAVISPSTPFTGDGAGDVGYGFPSIAPGTSTKPVVFIYRVF